MDVKLAAFEGPLELLLHLITKNEIDICDIPIAELADQYMACLNEMPQDMEGMSEFLVMAATLLEIKARMLLPKPPQSEPEESADPRAALVQKLVEYKYAQSLAELLKSLEPPGLRLVRPARLGIDPTRFTTAIECDTPLSKGALENDAFPADAAGATTPPPWWTPLLEGVTPDTLRHLYSEVMRRRALKIDTVRAHYNTVSKDRFTVKGKINDIRRRLAADGHLRFSTLFDSDAAREEKVVTFLALLEMIRMRWVLIAQADIFSDIEITLHSA